MLLYFWFTQSVRVSLFHSRDCLINGEDNRQTDIINPLETDIITKPNRTKAKLCVHFIGWIV